jgi:signal transduction histidine kinase
MDCAAAPAEPCVVPLGDLLAGLLRHRRLSRLPGPQIDVSGGSGAASEVRADRGYMRQVIANLLDNAAHFTPARGTVTVRTRAGDVPQTVVLTVSDTGCGIPPDELAHVFEFGFRGTAAAEAAVPGLGLGLWICRELVGCNGGTIAVASTLGAGTTVTVTLPAPPAPA